MAERVQRTCCRGVAQLLRGRPRKRSKIAAPRNSRGHSAGGAPNFDQTRLPTKEKSVQQLARDFRVESGRRAGEFKRAYVTRMKASQ